MQQLNVYLAGNTADNASPKNWVHSVSSRSVWREDTRSVQTANKGLMDDSEHYSVTCSF